LNILELKDELIELKLSESLKLCFGSLNLHISYFLGMIKGLQIHGNLSLFYKKDWSVDRRMSQKVKRLSNPLPTLTHGITGFLVPLHSPICSLSLLFSITKFSKNKIFLISAVLSFSEQAQEPWAREIPVRVICASMILPFNSNHPKYSLIPPFSLSV
jgi:hypothetical protein